MRFDNLGKIVSRGEIFNSIFIRKEIEQLKRILSTKIKDSRVVGIALPRTETLLISILAMLEAGIPFLLIDPNLPENRLNYMIENAGVRKVITVQSYKNDKLKNIEYITIDNIEVVGNQINDIKNIDVEDIAYIIYTSGTTGQPKGVEIKRKGLINFIEGISEAIDFSESKTIICMTSITFDIFFLETVFALMKGLTVVMANEDECNNPDKIIKLILKYNVDIIQMTPSRLNWLYIYSKNLTFLRNVRIIMIGGEAFPQALLTKLQENTKAQIYNMYGPTETTIWSTISNLTSAESVTIGQPIKNTAIYILDQKLCIVEKGKEGEICIAGDGLAKGYINNEDETNSKFVYLNDKSLTQIYRTGDVGKFEGDHLLCLGRKDNQVKCRGYRIELDEIDFRLSEMVELEATVTCCLKYGDVEELIVFYTASREVENREIISYLNQYLPEYMIPSRYIKVSAFDYTESGKTDIKQMINNYVLGEDKKIRHKKTNYDNITSKIMQICESILKRDVETIIDSKFEYIGVDSISFIKIIVQIEEDFNLEFEMEYLVDGNIHTIKDLVNYVYSCVGLEEK